MSNNNSPSTDNVTPINNNTRRILEEFEIQQIIENRVNELNQRYTHVVSKGKNYIVRIGKDSLYNPYLEFFTVREFRDMLSHQPDVVVGYTKQYEPKMKTVADVWLKSSQANICETGVTFHPTPTRYYKGMLNAYFGLGVEPESYKTSDLEIYLNHVYEIICNRDKDCFNYVINWLAHAIQKPEEKPEVAIILKAGQGTGKGTFVDPIGKIFGAHYLHATKPEHIVGRFNSMLENKILLFADEFFAGSKAHTDQLKGMITEKTASIERKGIDTIPVPSFTRLIMASNHDNIVIIEKDERRYLYLEVNEERKQDHAYFEKLHDVINGKGFSEKLLKFLQDRDISNFNPRQIPYTQALVEQKIDSLEPLEKWMYNALVDGKLTGGKWPVRETSEAIVEAVEIWLDARKLSVWGDLPKKLGKLLSKLGFKKERPMVNGERKYIYETPTIDEAKTKFCEMMNGKVDF